MKITPERIEADRRVLELLVQNFPTVSSAATEIINLEAILNLPKGTEHFVADVHGEHAAFSHILRNASGDIRRKVSELFANQLAEADIRDICSLIYYPEQKLALVREEGALTENFYNVTLHRLVSVCRSVASKYTRSKVRKALPREFAYIIEELLHENDADSHDKQEYFARIIESIVSTGQADQFVVALCNVIQRLAIDRLHLLGDVFDRGPGAHLIMDMLCDYPSFDIQWGNHDALWMGAAAGNTCCIANVLRLSLRYGNMATLEDGYGINLVPLATFALDRYQDDACAKFQPTLNPGDKNDDPKNRDLLAKMHKAVSIIQFKLEGQMARRYPKWKMEHRNLLDKINLQEGTIRIGDATYTLNDTNFPTLLPEDPYALTAEEQSLMERLQHSFLVSDKLQRHIRCLFSHGCLYTISNSNLLFHASVPLDSEGNLKEVTLPSGETYSGRQLLHNIGMMMRSAFNDDTPPAERQAAVDYYWYLWCGPDSPLFDKDRMATFERYFIDDKATHHEEKGWYYKLRNDESVCNRILDAFGVEGDDRHIINGHVPVRLPKGEQPIRANGRLMVIDGGFSQPYHQTTGIAGYTLVYHSRGFQLVQHEPFTGADDAVRNGTDIRSTTQIVELSAHRRRVRHTDRGRQLQAQIDELRELLYAYRHGLITEQGTSHNL